LKKLSCEDNAVKKKVATGKQLQFSLLKFYAVHGINLTVKLKAQQRKPDRFYIYF
jgi:hypothetical protein